MSFNEKIIIGFKQAKQISQIQKVYHQKNERMNLSIKVLKRRKIGRRRRRTKNKDTKLLSISNRDRPQKLRLICEAGLFLLTHVPNSLCQMVYISIPIIEPNILTGPPL